MSTVTITLAGKRFPRLVFGLTGDDSVTGGVGGWETLDRSGRVQSVAWVGTPAVTWALPLILDGMDTDQSVESDVSRLLEWASSDSPSVPPAVLSVSAPAGRAPSGSTWVIQDIEWGEQVRNGANRRTQQELVLTLLEYVPGAVLRGPVAKSNAAKGKHKWVPISGENKKCKQCKKPRDTAKHTNRK